MFGLMPRRREKVAGPLVPETHSLLVMRREMDELFNRFFGLWPLEWAEEMEVPAAWGLKEEETEKEVVFKAEAPGFEIGDFQVQLVGDLLTIEARKEAKGKEGEAVERRTVLRRYVTVPPGTDPNKLEAFYRNGVLEVHIPKTAEAMGRKIEVKP